MAISVMSGVRLMFRCSWLLVCFVVALSGCGDSRETILHTMDAAPYPWTDKSPQYDPSAMRFVVFSDLTGGEREGVFEAAVAQINLLRPELIVNVGDLIEGGTDLADLNAQWDHFDERAGRASAPVVYVGGNHDLMGFEMRDVWQQRIGPRYFHFRYRDVLFLVLDTDDHTPERMQEIIEMRTAAYEVARTKGWGAFADTAYANHPEDETGMISTTQADDLVKAIQDNRDVRWTFVLAHKAPWKSDDMPGWLAIESALSSRPYTVFHGHRHAYQHEVRQGRDYIRLATTGGVFLPQNGPSMDHLVMVTVDEEGAHLANLKMSGILNKSGAVPVHPDLCLEAPCE